MPFVWRKPKTSWELESANSRYKHHRNKVRTAKHAIDCDPPEARPHVYIKRKKLLSEETRQVEIIKENLRLLNTTARIASGYQTFACSDEGWKANVSWNDAWSSKTESGKSSALGKPLTRFFSRKVNRVRPVTTTVITVTADTPTAI